MKEKKHTVALKHFHLLMERLGCLIYSQLYSLIWSWSHQMMGHKTLLICCLAARVSSAQAVFFYVHTANDVSVLNEV